MAGTTVIDRLVMEFGLDPALFKKGSKEVQKDQKETQESVTHSAGEIIGALRKVAAEFISLFLVVRSVHDVVGLFADLNEATRQLGINSRNTGESAAQLRDWGNIAEMAGGKAEDAMGSISGLQQSIFNAKEGFGYSDQLINFGRIGVDTGAAQGKMRNFHDILADTAKALQQFSTPDRFQWAQKLGLQGGIANAVVEGPDVLEKYWQQQLKIHQTTDGDTRAAQELAKSWDLLKDKMRALTTQILTAVSPAIQHLFDALGGFLSKHQAQFTEGINDLAKWAQGDGPRKIVDALVSVGDAAVSVAEFLGKVFGSHKATQDELLGNETSFAFNSQKTATEKKYKLPDGLLDNKDLRGSTLDLDQRADALSVLHDEAGGDKGDPDWSKAVALFKQRYTDQSLVKKGLLERQGDWWRTHTWYGSPIDNASKAGAGVGASPGARQTADMTAAGKPTADTGSRGNVSVDIDKLNVYTQATDADGMAAGAGNALKRKLTVTLADGALS
jgi:hypothetical protein